MVWDGVVGDGEAKGRTNNSWCSTRRLTHRFPDDVGMPGPGPEPTFRSQKGASLSGVRWYLGLTLISRRGVVAQDGGPRCEGGLERTASVGTTLSSCHSSGLHLGSLKHS